MKLLQSHEETYKNKTAIFFITKCFIYGTFHEKATEVIIGVEPTEKYFCVSVRLKP